MSWVACGSDSGRSGLRWRVLGPLPKLQVSCQPLVGRVQPRFLVLGLLWEGLCGSALRPSAPGCALGCGEGQVSLHSAMPTWSCSAMGRMTVETGRMSRAARAPRDSLACADGHSCPQPALWQGTPTVWTADGESCLG